MSDNAQYIRWRREIDTWVGFAEDSVGEVKILTIETHKRAGKKVVYLRRRDDSVEIVRTIARAKAYGNNLARLWNFKPIDPDANRKKIRGGKYQ